MASFEVLPNPDVSAETLKACALIGLHLLAADYEVGSSGSQSPDVGDMWKYVCPKRSDLEQNVVYEHNNESRVIEVIGQDWSSEVVAPFLEDWELRRAALSCHMTMDFLC